jgi:hypothetical protein
MRFKDSRDVGRVRQQRSGFEDAKGQARPLENGGTKMCGIVPRMVNQSVSLVPMRPQRQRPRTRERVARENQVAPPGIICSGR